jgi:murein DD-endopeptidase
MRLSLRMGCLLCFAVCLIVACAPATTKPANSHATATGEKAAHIALSMVGRPYQYKGNSPAGFDCSGLVQYSYQAAGMDVPHGTKSLVNITRSAGAHLQTGDLLFFNERGKKYSHVGIYLGNDTFVHAPSTGGRVRKDSLQDPYWKKSFFEARRFM